MSVGDCCSCEDAIMSCICSGMHGSASKMHRRLQKMGCPGWQVTGGVRRSSRCCKLFLPTGPGPGLPWPRTPACSLMTRGRFCSGCGITHKSPSPSLLRFTPCANVLLGCHQLERSCIALLVTSHRLLTIAQKHLFCASLSTTAAGRVILA